MLFINSIVKYLFSPEIFLVIGIFLIWILRKRIKPRNILLTLTLLWFFLIYVSPLPIYLAEKWERAYPAFDIKNHPELKTTPAHIVILGAGYTNDPNISVTSQLGKSVSMRLMEGVRIYNLLDSAKLITSGAALGKSRSQAEAVADAAVSLGVSPEDTRWLPNTLNTEGEAEAYAKHGVWGMELGAWGMELGDSIHTSMQSYIYTRSRPNTAKVSKTAVIIVTSAVHMKRAVFWFEYFTGIKVIPAPCNYLFKEDPSDPEFRWKPSWKKIEMLDKVMDEWLGLLWGRFRV